MHTHDPHDSLDPATNEYYNEDGKNISEYVVFNRTTLQLTPPKTSMKGYAYPVKAKLKFGVAPEIKRDRWTWVWGVPVR